jgi:hypothetical protein
MRRLVAGEPAQRLLELPRRPDAVAARRLVPGDGDVHEALVEVPLLRRRRTPGELELLVRLEVAAGAEVREPGLVRVSHAFYISAVATILLCGVDLFFRGKLEALLPEHHFITVDHTDAPDLVIVDIARVDPEEVADTYPDVPILGYTNHTDTAGLRAGHAAGFDQVVVKSALVERARELVEELAPSG